ncbi:MAG: hypothetical protein OZ918_03360 [Nitrospirales bacterium]|nr:hypothetical protein [Nitrospirales bacterium]
MGHGSATPSRLPLAWMPALALGLVLTLPCAAALYLLLAQHDRALVQERNAAAVTATGQSARAIAQTLAWMGEALLQDNVAALQETLVRHARQAGLLEAAVIGTDNVIIAADNPAAVGEPVRDATRPAVTNAAGGVASSLHQGRPAFTIVVPIRQNGHVVAWVNVVAAAPLSSAAHRTPEDLGRDVMLVIAPLFFVTTMLAAVTIRSVINKTRRLLRRILLDAAKGIPPVARTN